MRYFLGLALILSACITTIHTSSAEELSPISPYPISLSTLMGDAETLNAEIASGSLILKGRTRGFTPMFYAADFPRYFGGGTGGTLILDDWAEIDPTETILFPKSVVTIKKILIYKGHTLLEVTSKEYPYDSDPHYIDARFVQVYETERPLRERTPDLPSQKEIIEKLRSQVGKSYVWGGNATNGVPNLARYYPGKMDNEMVRAQWILDGFDCSGLLYWATDGATPRNTSSLVSYGTGLKIAGKTADEIIPLLKPLDIIVWRGHNLIVIDKGQVIESTVNFTGTGNYSVPNGVRIRDAKTVLEEIFTVRNRIGVDSFEDAVPEGKKKFVIRRWY